MLIRRYEVKKWLLSTVIFQSNVSTRQAGRGVKAPQTQGWFRWWADLFPITAFQQAIQVVVPSANAQDRPQPRNGAGGRAHAGQSLKRLADADARHRRLLANPEGAITAAKSSQPGRPVQRHHARGCMPRGWCNRRRAAGGGGAAAAGGAGARGPRAAPAGGRV